MSNPRTAVIIPRVAMEGGTLAVVDQHAVENTEDRACRKGDQDGGDDRHPVGHQHGDQNVGKPDHGANREVDASRDDNERHADGDHTDNRHLAHEVGEIVQGEEARRREGQDDKEADQDENEGAFCEPRPEKRHHPREKTPARSSVPCSRFPSIPVHDSRCQAEDLFLFEIGPRNGPRHAALVDDDDPVRKAHDLGNTRKRI